MFCILERKEKAQKSVVCTAASWNAERQLRFAAVVPEESVGSTAGRGQAKAPLSRRTLKVVAPAIVAAFLLIAPRMASAQAKTDFEKPPVLNVRDLVAENLLQGKGFHVEEKVPTDGVMGTYTLIADKETFGEDAGTYQVLSREMAELRLSEIPAIIKLNETSKTGTFVKAMATTAVQPLESAGNMVMNPIDTVTGLPSGVGRLFDRVGTGVGNLWDPPADSNKSGLEQAGAATRDALGYEQERRALAHKLGVDPYTSNPILAKKLDKIAWVSFSAHLAVSAAISVAVPGSMIITGVLTMDNLVWDTPRGDLIVRVETKLEELKTPKEQRSAFMHNTVLPLSLQVAVVGNLGRLTGVSGRGDVVTLLGQVTTEAQARFLATSLRMLAEYHEKRNPLTDIGTPGPLVARDQTGAVIMPAPVDYLCWTERVAAFATQPAFLSVSQRTLWVAGQLSPRAKKEFAANGWNIQESAQP